MNFVPSFSRFAMLESGAYPSYHEIGELLAKGIDFEARQDENIILELDIPNTLRIIEKHLELTETEMKNKNDIICTIIYRLMIGPKLPEFILKDSDTVES